MCAFARFAMNSCPAGGIALSSKVIRSQLGMVFQAGGPDGWTIAVTPGFFKTFGVPVLRGRAITSEDRYGTAPVALVNEAFVRHNFSRGDAIGRRIRLGGTDSDRDWVTIVGVIPTLYATSIDEPFPPAVITPLWQERQLSSLTLAVRGPNSRFAT